APGAAGTRTRSRSLRDDRGCRARSTCLARAVRAFARRRFDRPGDAIRVRSSRRSLLARVCRCERRMDSQSSRSPSPRPEPEAGSSARSVQINPTCPTRPACPTHLTYLAHLAYPAYPAYLAYPAHPAYLAHLAHPAYPAYLAHPAYRDHIAPYRRYCF